MALIAEKLAGRAAVVTGAGRGIGRAVTEKLAAAGAAVLAADVETIAVRRAVQRLQNKGAKAASCAVDVADAVSVESMVGQALNVFGRLDILVNNAGILFRTRFEHIPLNEWERVLQVNLTGPFLCMQASLPAMRKNRFGRIVNLSSSAGRSVSTLGGAHYTASKAGLLGLTRAVAKEVAGAGITVNAVCPGLIDTPMVRATTTPEELRDCSRSFPVARLGRPEEVGDLVVFLCSDEAAYITGAAVDITGGDLMI